MHETWVKSTVLEPPEGIRFLALTYYDGNNDVIPRTPSYALVTHVGDNYVTEVGIRISRPQFWQMPEPPQEWYDMIGTHSPIKWTISGSPVKILSTGIPIWST